MTRLVSHRALRWAVVAVAFVAVVAVAWTRQDGAQTVVAAPAQQTDTPAPDAPATDAPTTTAAPVEGTDAPPPTTVPEPVDPTDDILQDGEKLDPVGSPDEVERRRLSAGDAIVCGDLEIAFHLHYDGQADEAATRLADGLARGAEADDAELRTAAGELAGTDLGSDAWDETTRRVLLVCQGLGYEPL